MTLSSSGPAYGHGSLQQLLDRLLGTTAQPTRCVFFSFHYQRDIWRANHVRNHWVTKGNYKAAGYFDRSLWENARTDGKARIKRLIDDGLFGSSVTCVLIGTETFSRDWVAYEIFRSVERGNGVFGVFIDGLKDRNGHIDMRGLNPFDFLGYAPTNRYSGRLIPCVRYTGGWKLYEDASPIIIRAALYPWPDSVLTLSDLFRFPVYDWVAHGGYHNFSTWVQAAASQAGR